MMRQMLSFVFFLFICFLVFPGQAQPWKYGDDALRNFRKYDLLHYWLLPYPYSTAYQNYRITLDIFPTTRSCGSRPGEPTRTITGLRCGFSPPSAVLKPIVHS
jgi:hypothetical protein